MARMKAMGGGKAPSPQEIEEAKARLAGLGGPGLGGLGGGLPKLPGLGGGLPPGVNPFKKS